MSHRRLPRWLVWPALTVLVVGIVLQFVPYGWDHSNPPVIADAPWPTAASRDAARSSCYSCHSNETDWPIYSYVAPMSWLVRSDVENGRDELNFSTWHRDDNEADKAIEAIREGSMPPWRYTIAHPGSSLSAREKRELIDALAVMAEADDSGGNRGRGGGDD